MGKSQLLRGVVETARTMGVSVRTVRARCDQRDSDGYVVGQLVAGGRTDGTEGLRLAVAAEAGRSGALIAIDDAHWMDRASMSWLAGLRWHTPALPLALILTGCSGAWVGDVERLAGSTPGGHRWVLDHLDVWETHAFLSWQLGVPVPWEVGAAAQREVGGNPKLLTQLLTIMIVTRSPLTAPAVAHVAGTHAAAIGRPVTARVEAAGAELVAVCRALAVLTTAEITTVAAVLGLTPQRVDHLVRALIDMGVVGMTASTGLTLTQPVVRYALSHGVADPDRYHVPAARHGRGQSGVRHPRTPASPARRPAPADPALLTPHQHRIAGLVIAGNTNRQIAGQLRVSPRAVEFHLTTIYRKLGIARRAQLAAALTRLLS
ncbi:helix-turn-helix transcriptional regulator [Micromonospora sp. HUAS LYJ1]|nr:helix-turn-helix transcriptional regulator [Micromonospora sp. HUAS LYJ1]WKU02986.1 helix-turn-helix transcriptional regulator [Micromonospora sp. HUAS LYJ1]